MEVITGMTREDAGQVYKLQKACFAAPWSYQSILEMFDRPGYLNLTAREEDRIVGYIGLLAALDQADITNVAVDPGYRRRGTGSRLLAALLGKARGEGIRQIYLEVRRSNLAAIRLYEQAGFTIIGERKKYYVNPDEDALIMALTFA
ncbi:MAG: ribosomal protein S18-alanine N-acetyltransferase [Eubacterium sp.]|nr:ribosomal protein S18-alanine N-acetyltransferase [Eubacterium sp.]